MGVLHVPERDAAYRLGASIPGILAAALLTPFAAHGGEFPVPSGKAPTSP